MDESLRHLARANLIGYLLHSSKELVLVIVVRTRCFRGLSSSDLQELNLAVFIRDVVLFDERSEALDQLFLVVEVLLTDQSQYGIESLLKTFILELVFRDHGA